MTLKDQIAAARALADAATKGEWRWIAKGPREAARAFLTETFDLSDGDTVHGVGIAAPGRTIEEECLTIAITGNGPTSEANAKYLLAAHATLPNVLTLLERACELLEDDERCEAVGAEDHDTLYCSACATTNRRNKRVRAFLAGKVTRG